MEDPNCILDNNSAESFNKRFPTAVPKSPSTWRIIHQFQQEEAFTNYKLDKAIEGDLGLPDNTRDRSKERKLRKSLKVTRMMPTSQYKNIILLQMFLPLSSS